MLKITVVLDVNDTIFYNNLINYFCGKKSAKELNEHVFCNGFIPVRYQLQQRMKHGKCVVVHGYATDEFISKEIKKIENNYYDVGWTLFLDDPQGLNTFRTAMQI